MPSKASPSKDEYTYDVYVSFSSADESWVEQHLLPQLDSAGLSVCVPRSMPLGRPIIDNIEDAVTQSRKTLLVLTPRWLTSDWSRYEALLVGTSDPAGALARTIPLIVEPCDLPRRISGLAAADLTRPERREAELERVVASLGRPIKVFISYKRNVKPDTDLALNLRQQLADAGYTILIDQDLRVGEQWAVSLQQKIESSDFVIVLLSEQSIRSEMVIKEVEHAYEHHLHTGKARLLPVRVNYSGALPFPLSTYLMSIQQAEWRSRTRDNTARLVAQLRDVIGFGEELSKPIAPAASSAPEILTIPTQPPAPLPYADPKFIASLAEPTGAVATSDPIYVERKADEVVKRELSKERGATITIRAPRQSGKSSLLFRGVKFAEDKGNYSIFINFQTLESPYIQNIDVFLRYLATEIATNSGFDIAIINKYWHNNTPAAQNITNLLRKEILPRVQSKITLAIDEADKLLNTDISNDIFGMFRSWHDLRAKEAAWNKLNILLVISTEPYLLIGEPNQSPFNVGTKVLLDDFDRKQTLKLNEGYRNPLTSDYIDAFIDLLGGHPYLTSKALYTMVVDELSWEELVKVSRSDRGPFGDHLKRYWWLLRDEPQLVEALRQFIRSQIYPEQLAFYRLVQAGLLTGDDPRECAFRCKLYEQYFSAKI